MSYFRDLTPPVCFVFAQGEIFLNGGSCRIIQRHLLFNGGVAYGIDCLLAPPSLGGRCDTKTGVDITVSNRHGYQIVTPYVSAVNGLSNVLVAIECILSDGSQMAEGESDG